MSKSLFCTAAVLTLLVAPLAALAQAVQDNDLSRRVIVFQDIAFAAGETLKKAIGATPVGTINEVSYRQVPVMYEIDQMLNRRRVEVVIRYDGERVPVTQNKRPKVIEKRKIDAAKLPPAVASSVTRQFGQDPLDEVREITYRSSLVLYEVDSGERAYGFKLDGEIAFKGKKPATAPAEQEEEAAEQEEQKDDGGADDGSKSDDAD